MSIKPATPLPWGKITTPADVLLQSKYPDGSFSYVVNGGKAQEADFYYIANSANAYPKLVDALRDLVLMVNETTNRGNGKAAKSAAALLRELGEEA